MFVSSADLLLALAVLAWFDVVGAFVVFGVATEKRRGAFGWMFVSLIAGPIVPLLALAALPPRDRS